MEIRRCRVVVPGSGSFHSVHSHLHVEGDIRQYDASLRITLIGVLVGLGWYYLSFAILWRNINPLITLYTHRGPMMAGHALYGGLLGRFPRYLHPPVTGGAAPHAQ